jgi:hypothetical protein
MKSIKILSLLCLSAALFTACESTLKVTSDYDKSVNFSGYKTFNFYNLKTSGSVSQLNAERIANAIRRELTKKGLTETSNNPDLMVNAVTILKDKKEVTATTNYYGYGGAYRPYGYYGGAGASGYTTVSTYEYKDGSLIIDIVDAKTNKVVWEGIGNKDIDKAPKNPEEAINNAVTSILAGYPPAK